MARRTFGSSQRARRVRKSDGATRPFSPAEARRAKPAPPDAAIDFSAIPEATDAELEAMVRDRAARLAHLATPRQKVVITMRIDPELLKATKALARVRGVKYQALMQQLLAGAVLRETGAGR